MQNLNITYLSYDVHDGSGPEPQELNLTVTDEVANVILTASGLTPDLYAATFWPDELRVLHTLLKVCEGLEQLSGRSIFQRGETRPWMYGGMEIEFDAVVIHCEEDEEDEEDEDEEG